MTYLLQSDVESSKRRSADSALLFVESMARMGAAFVVAILIGRQYGPDGLGLVTTANSWVVIFMGFSALGLSGVLVRELVEHPANRGTLLLTVTLAKLGAGAVLLGALLVVLSTLGQGATLVKMGLIMGLGQLFASLDTVDCLYNARVEFKRLVSLRVAGLAISTGFKVAAIVFDWGIEYVAVGYGIDYCLMYLLPALDFAIRKRGGLSSDEIRLQFSAHDLKRLLGRSWPVLISGGVAQINLKVDVVMVSLIASVTSAGIYSAAARLSEAWSVIAMAIVTATFPHLVRLARTAHQDYGEQLSQMLRRLLWIGIAGAVIVALTSEFIVTTVYGNEFSASASVLTVHIVAGVFLFLRTAISRWLIIEDLLIFSLVSHIAGALVNVLINLVAIPHWGVIGAAWASVASYAASSVLFLLVSPRTRPMFALILVSILPNSSFTRKKSGQIAERMAANRKVKHE